MPVHTPTSIKKSHVLEKKREKEGCNSFSLAKKSYASSSNELSQRDRNSIPSWVSFPRVCVRMKWSGSQASVLPSVESGLT